MSEELERIKELIDDLVGAAQDNTDRHTRTSQLRLKSARHNVELEFTRLQAQVATLERIIQRETEKTTKAGQP